MASAPAGPDVSSTSSLIRRPELWLAGTAFLASGGAGLVYQVAWQRILALQSGVGIYSVAMIVAVFMAGLGIGSHLGGAWSLRLDAPGALRRFVLVELGIGVLGALSCFVYYDLLYRRALWIYDEPWRAALMHVAALLPPTVLMGMSLPLLSRAMVAEARNAGRVIGFLYAVNLLGAALGSLLTPWVLVPHYGIRGATYCAAAANLFTALTGLLATLLLRRRAPPEQEAAASAPAGDPDAPGGRPFSLWLVLYAASGFCALALELVWFRLLDVAVKSKAQTLGTLLALYLLGCGVGCLIGIWAVPRLRRPLRAFLLCQSGLLAYAGLMVVLLAFLPTDTPLIDRLYAYWSRGTYHTRHRLLLALYGELPALLFGPATVLMGLSFPILHRAVQDDPRTSGRKVGLLQAANIVGCVAGSLLVGLLTLRLLGSSGSLRLLMVCGVGFALVGLRAGGRRLAFALVAGLLALLAVMMPGQHRLWMRLHGSEMPDGLLREDESGVAALLPRPKSWVVFVDGKSHSWLPFGGVHTQLGAAPAIVHPAPLDVAIVGLGSGDTAWAALCRPETRALDVYEISSGQPRLLRSLAEREALPDLRAFLANPRLTVHHADGRHALASGHELYDVIEADALWPDVAYSGNLYSAEFFEMLSHRLKPKGLVCTWAPTPRVFGSFTSAFRYVVGPPGRTILIGSNDPIGDDLDEWKARLHSGPVQAYLGPERAGTVGALLRTLTGQNRQGRRPRSAEMNLDLFPRDEFDVPEEAEP